MFGGFTTRPVSPHSACAMKQARTGLPVPQTYGSDSHLQARLWTGKTDVRINYQGLGCLGVYRMRERGRPRPNLWIIRIRFASIHVYVAINPVNVGMDMSWHMHHDRCTFPTVKPAHLKWNADGPDEPRDDDAWLFIRRGRHLHQ